MLWGMIREHLMLAMQYEVVSIISLPILYIKIKDYSFMNFMGPV